MRFSPLFSLTLSLLAAVSLVLEYGFRIEPEAVRWLEGLDLGIAALFSLELLVDCVRRRSEALRARWHEFLLAGIFLVCLGAFEWLLPSSVLQDLLSGLGLGSVTRLYLVIVQGFVFWRVLLRFLRGQERLLSGNVRPERVFVGGFALLILLGTVLLLLPRSSADPGQPIGLLDAFFTSTSAVCVTGLAVRDTGADFSTTGQLVILFLFQVGGLGIVAFVGFLSFSTGKGFSVPQMVALREIVNAPTLGAVRKQILVLVGAALAIEAVGAAWLFEAVPESVVGVVARLHWAVFHSVSAFCNAGFALASDSLVAFDTHLPVNLCIMGLIVLGGIGAPVLGELGAVLRRSLRARGEGHRRLRLSVQTRISLVVTLVLIFGGALGIYLLEGPGASGPPPRGLILGSFFQSVSTRTAGFNTWDFGQLREGTLLLMMGLMIVGASPVSTGGGIKTVAFGVLVMTLRSMVTGRRVEAFGRTIPEVVVRASISTVVLYFASAVVVLFGLSLSDESVPLKDRAFETISALSTVGLSTGITASLSAVGKLLLCVAMFCGRVGPLSLAMMVFRMTGSERNYELPEEPLVLG